MIKNWRHSVQLRKAFREEVQTQDKKAYLEQKLWQFIRTKYTAICYFHWRELFKIKTKNRPFAKAVDKIEQRRAFSNIILLAKSH